MTTIDDDVFKFYKENAASGIKQGFVTSIQSGNVGFYFDFKPVAGGGGEIELVYSITDNAEDDLNVIEVTVAYETEIDPIPSELFVPNSFGDAFLYLEQMDDPIFVRDILPTNEQIMLILESRPYRFDYQREAYNRPLIGDNTRYINKIICSGRFDK